MTEHDKVQAYANKSLAIAGTTARCAVNFEAGSSDWPLCHMAQVPPSTNTRRRPLRI